MIAKSAGGAAGSIKQGGTYYVYANVTGSGTPPAGLGSLTADVSAITTGQTAAALSSGSYTVDGQSYNYRSARSPPRAACPAGTDAFTVKLTDSAGTATSTSYSVTVNNTAPRASDIQTANVAGGTAGKPELGDTMTFTFSEPIDPDTVLSGWDGSQPSRSSWPSSTAAPPATTSSSVLNASTLAHAAVRHRRPRPQGLRVQDDRLRRLGHRLQHGAERERHHGHARDARARPRGPPRATGTLSLDAVVHA